jgi:hypothetical protein
MYQIVKKGMEYDLFSDQVMYVFYNKISDEISTMLKTTKEPKPAILGAFALHDVPLKTGGKTNVWIEYNAKILPFGIDAGVHQCIIFDEIPDIILDKYNELKTLLFKDAITNKPKI